ncbi:MAG: hypothetical protein CME19_19995 [Gemmatimonadetes bacterium]|nr:hypothetical protein [Gemmatimonadota bacterium]
MDGLYRETERPLKLPGEIERALSGFTTSGENYKTASESDVFRYTSSDQTVFLKIQGQTWSPPLSRERNAMVWLADKLSVPEVVAYHRDGDREYLITTAIEGISSENDECHGNKQHLVESLAEALLTIHALPIDDCPIDKTPDALLDEGRRRIDDGIVTEEMVVEVGLSGSPSEALDGLAARRPDLDRPVFTHGDYCLPNIMIHDNDVSGFIDLGYAGSGDPYRDYKAARYSVKRNLGEEWVGPFFEAMGVTLDMQRINWYGEIEAFG